MQVVAVPNYEGYHPEEDGDGYAPYEAISACQASFSSRKPLSHVVIRLEGKVPHDATD